MCRASHVSAEIFAGRLPVVAPGVLSLIAKDCIPGGSRENLRHASTFTDWKGATRAQQTLLTDAQTSGGLLVCIRPRNLEALEHLLRRHRTPCVAVVGRIIHARRPLITILP